METMETILSRKSIRSFTGEKTTQTTLDTILEAANASPVGLGKFEDMHLTVIEDKSLLQSIDESAAKMFGDPKFHPLYGAPTLVVVSAKSEENQNIPHSNAAIMAHNMILAATDLGAGCCHIWGAIAALNSNINLVKQLNLPDGFAPSCGVVIGETTEKYTLRNIPENRVKVDYIK